MPVYISTIRLDAQSLTQAPAKASATARILQERLVQAQTFTDPNLSPEGTAAKRAEIRASQQAEGRSMLDAMRADLMNATKRLAEYAREHTQIADNPAALIRAEQKWRQTEQILNAGGDLQTVLRTADADTATAVLEFAPSWIAARSQNGKDLTSVLGQALSGDDGPDPATAIRHAAYTRLAEVHPNSDVRELLAAQSTAQANIEMAEPWMSATESLVTTGGANMLAAALASQTIAATHSPAAGEATAA